MSERNSKGKLYLFPNLLAEDDLHQSIPVFNQELLKEIKVFFVENSKSARKYLKINGIEAPYDHLTFFALNKRTKIQEQVEYLMPLLNGEQAAVISDAGLPAVADPGAALIEMAHQNGIEVIPLVGPSSIFLALMASGMNGQHFCFKGYLPIKQNSRVKAIKDLTQEISKTGATQIFMETPYRNISLIQDLIKNCHPQLRLCVAANLQSRNQKIHVKTLQEWQQTDLKFLDKVPAIFCMNFAHKG